MAFGFPAYHSDEFIIRKSGIDLEGAVLAALQELEWGLAERTDDCVTAEVGMGLRTWGEVVSIDFASGNSVRITSKCVLPTQCFDWGKNKANVSKFLSALKDRI